MQVVKRLAPWMAIVLLGAAGFTLPVAPALAYVPSQEDLLAQLAAGAPGVSSAILELRCSVFPLPPPANAVPGAQPMADPARSFRQHVYWQRGRLLAVETVAEDGALLHVLLQEGGFIQAAQVTAARQFSLADVRPLMFPFLEGTVAAWRDELGYWGVRPAAVDLVLVKTAQWYRLTDGPDRALFVDKDSLRPARLVTQVQGGPVPWLVSVEFSDFVSFATKGPEKDQLTIPRRVTYALNGAAFKDVRMTGFEVDPPARRIPLARLRQLAAAAPAGRPQ